MGIGQFCEWKFSCRCSGSCSCIGTDSSRSSGGDSSRGSGRGSGSRFRGILDTVKTRQDRH